MKAKKLLGSATPTHGQSADKGSETNHGLENHVEHKKELASTIIEKHRGRAVVLNAGVRNAGDSVSKLVGDVMRNLKVTSTLDGPQLVGAVVAISVVMHNPLQRAEWSETGTAYLRDHLEVSPLLHFGFDVLTTSLEKRLRDLGMKRAAGAKYFKGKCDEEVLIALAEETHSGVWVLDEAGDKVWIVKSGVPQAQRLISSENMDSGASAIVVVPAGEGPPVHSEDSSAPPSTVEVPVASVGEGAMVHPEDSSEVPVVPADEGATVHPEDSSAPPSTIEMPVPLKRLSAYGIRKVPPGITAK
jgi:hypothetical protein